MISIANVYFESLFKLSFPVLMFCCHSKAGTTKLGTKATDILSIDVAKITDQITLLIQLLVIPLIRETLLKGKA